MRNSGKISNRLFSVAVLAGALAALLLAGCSGVQKEAKYPTGAERTAISNPNAIYEEEPSIFGEGGLNIFGNSRAAEGDGGGASGIGVNTYLWRASLDTVSFMPLASADPFGGVILTDWYSAPETPNERFKLNVFILDRQLRSDGVQVKVFKQARKSGEWRDIAVADGTERSIEDAILTRARQMRVSQVGKEKQ